MERHKIISVVNEILGNGELSVEQAVEKIADLAMTHGLKQAEALIELKNKEIECLQGTIISMADRIHKQSELLSRKAEKK